MVAIRSSKSVSLASALSQAPQDTAPHLIVEARAGTGKTTTLVAALQVLKGQTPTDARGNPITPSPQQQAVWDAVCLSKGEASTVCFVAFNKSIADELKTRVPAGVEAMTMHSMGLRAVTKAFPELRSFNLNEGRNVVPNLIAGLLGKDVWAVRKDKNLRLMVDAVDRLVSLCKMNLIDPGENYEDCKQQLSALTAQYEIDLNGDESRVFSLVPQVLEACKEHRTGFNFDDMIWLPIVLNLPVTRYDLLLVDEAQDLNRCQQALAKRAGQRLILCGDPKQAIYVFAGADSESMPRMARELGVDQRGCVTLPLTVTRRCGKAIVREANRYVQDFQAYDTNPEGSISKLTMDDMGCNLANGKPVGLDHRQEVREGDLVLCRVNSRIVSQCLQFVKAGIRAYIQGRDVGKGLINLVEKQKATTVAELIGKISTWCDNETAKEQAKPNPVESVIEGFRDRRDCIIALAEGLAATDDVVLVTRKLEAIFSDQNPGNCIKLSSIHKAKGTEARRVFLLSLPFKREGKESTPKFVMDWVKDPEQEFNLLYVAITRAIEEFIYVS